MRLKFLYKKSLNPDEKPFYKEIFWCPDNLKTIAELTSFLLKNNSKILEITQQGNLQVALSIDGFSLPKNQMIKHLLKEDEEVE